MLRQIPAGAVEIQTGLWLYTSMFSVGDMTYERREIFSSEGFCFYNKSAEIYREDEEGNLILVPDEEILPNQRNLMQYAHLGLADDVSNYVSIKLEADYETV